MTLAKGWQGAEAVQGALQAFRLAADGNAAEVEELAEDLDLREDEAAFRGLAVLRHHEDDDVVLADEAAGEEARFFMGARRLEPPQQAGLVVGFGPGTDFHDGDLGRLQEL